MKFFGLYSLLVALLLSVAADTVSAATSTPVSDMRARRLERIRLRRNGVPIRTVRRSTTTQPTLQLRPTDIERPRSRRTRTESNARLLRLSRIHRIVSGSTLPARPTHFDRVRIRRPDSISTTAHRTPPTERQQYRRNLRSLFDGKQRVSRRMRVQQARNQNSEFRSRLNARRRQLLNKARQQQLTPTSSPQSSLPQVRVRDPLTDTTTRSQLILLNSISPILGGGQVFSNSEPIEVEDIIILLTSEVDSVSQLLVYDHNAQFLGNAALDTSISGRRGYRLPLPTGRLAIPYRENFSFYVRARLKDDTSGGTSGDSITVDSLGIDGNGAWSNKPYSQSTSEDYLSFETTQSSLHTIVNAGSIEDVLVGGTDRKIGSFRFGAIESDSSAEARLLTIKFTVESFGGVSISNAVIRRQDVPDSFACTTTTTAITCSSIPAEFGSIDTQPLLLNVYADIETPVTGNDQFLRLSINDPGTINTAGDITWTDGFATFTWLPLDRPVVRGTGYTR